MLRTITTAAGTLCLALFLTLGLNLNAIAQPVPDIAQESAQGEEQPEEEKKPTIALDQEKLQETQNFMGNWEKRVSQTLEKYGLAGSVLGKTVATTGVVIVAVILSLIVHGLLKRLSKYLDKLGQRFHFKIHRLHIYRRIVMIFVNLVLLILIGVSALVIWLDHESVETIVNGLTVVLSVLSNVFSFLIVAVVIFESVSAALEHYFARLGRHGSSRVNTLLPIARNVIYGALFVVFAITLIAELGINVMPLLAGAGVVGFAIGFGAQTLMKDLITGFIIIIEDLVQVGDIVSVGGKAGVVERITIRKVQLRDLGGIVYTVPFSEIGIVENFTKNFSYYLLNIGIAYRESPDEVIELTRKILEEMQGEDDYKDFILEPLDVLGVDAFGDSAIIIKARIKTLPGKQWTVGREFNRRMKYVFDENNIEIPFPHRTLYFGEGKDGSAPAANLRLSRDDKPANDPEAGDKQEHSSNPDIAKDSHEKVDNTDSEET